MKNKEICDYLDRIHPNPKCPLNYNKDYELLIAVVLSAQSKDDQVNKVTKELFTKYDINSLAKASKEEIIDILRPCGNMNKKSDYIIKICKSLLNDHNGTVPCNREYLERLPGVGRKTTNVILATLFDIPAFAVDTHIERVAKTLGYADENDSVLEVEQKLMKAFEPQTWGKRHLQILLFGRYICKKNKPKCEECELHKYCKNKKCI